MSIFGNERRLFLEGEAETVKLGSELARLAQASEQGLTVFLDGDLGMGKTTLSRGVIRALGHEGAVKSLTYTLVSPMKTWNRRFTTSTCTGWATLKNWNTWVSVTISPVAVSA